MTQPERPILDHDRPRDTGQPRGCSGRALVWILGIGAGIVLLCCTVLLLQMSKGVERSSRIKCGAHLRIIEQGISLYRHDHGVWPQTLAEILIAGDLNPEVFTCQSSGANKAPVQTLEEAARSLTNPKHCSYLYFPPPADAGDVDVKTVLAAERMANHQNKGMNILFADGHTEWFDVKAAEFIISELKAGHNPPRWPATQPANTPAAR